jgi:WD40 repeat protein/serine/threonine protein kinase
MASSESGDYNLLDRLVEDFGDRYRRGERPSLAEYIDRYPHLAEDLRDLLPAMAEIEHAKQQCRGASAPAAEPLPGQVGDYRIISEIGRGGMGVVYEAEQLSLGRRVALKVLPRRAAVDGVVLERFRLEARSAAGLHHTNIVPVFEVGQDGDTCFYAMQLIRGQSLDQVIEELRRLRAAEGAATTPQLEVGEPAARSAARSLLTGRFAAPTTQTGRSEAPGTDPSSPPAALPGQTELSSGQPRCPHYFRSVARIGQQAAAALAHAHARGIIHRDVKPSNLLLDTTGVVWVTDFGLAKTEDTALTATGDIVGTLCYMAPERFRGEGDARADIYALGLTLYELLVLRPAFEATDRVELIDRIQHLEPPKPRALDARIPRDLETVVLKAADKDPAQRYASADDLADDLRRFLGDESIRARRASPAERLLRWSRRHRTVAVCILIIGLLLLTATIAALGAAARFQGVAREADAARALAEDRAETVRQHLYHAHMNLAHQAWREVLGLGRMQELLDGWRTDDPSRDLRGWEWYYLASLPHYEAFTVHHDAPARCVGCSPDGRWLASGAEDGVVKITDARTGKLRAKLPAHAGTVWALAWHPDSKQLAWAGDDSVVWIRAAVDGTAEVPLRGHAGEVHAVAWAPDGKRLASAGADGTVVVWDVDARQQVLILRGHEGEVNALDWRFDGARLVSTGIDQTIRIWDLATGRVVRTIFSPAWGLRACWSPDGKQLASNSVEHLTVKVWDADTGKELRAFHGHKAEVLAVAYNHDGSRLASASLDGTVKVWDAESGIVLRTFRGHTGWVLAIAWGADGKTLASASSDGTVRVWDAEREPGALVLRGHRDTIKSVAWAPDSRKLASGGEDRTIHLWDAATGRQIAVLGGHEGEVRSVDWSPDGRRLASASWDGSVRIWDTEKAEKIATFRTGSEVNGAAWSPDGLGLASAHIDQTVRIWDAATGKETAVLRGHADSVSMVRWSPNGRRLASAAADATVRIWDVAGQREIAVLRGHDAPVTAVAWSRGGELLSSASFDRTIKIWNTTTWAEVQSLEGHTDILYSVAWNPDGTRVASAGRDHCVKVWGLATGLELLSLRTHSNLVSSVAWSPDGTRLASASFDRTIHIYDATVGYDRERQRTSHPPSTTDRTLAPHP